MPDETVPPTPAPSDPNKPGTQTSEFKVATVIGAVGAVVAGASLTLSQLHDLFPGSTWIATCVGIVAGLGTMLAVGMKFIGSRTEVKTGQLKLEAAKQIAAASLPPSP